MKKNSVVLYLICFMSAVCSMAENRPIEGVQPPSDIPVLYVNTEDNQPVDQKETYINATCWLDASMLDGILSLGSEDNPLTLGVRGRGNASWLFDGQKPYKIKFDKKQNVLDMGKNKHWALLAPCVNYKRPYNEIVGFEIGRQLKMQFIPESKPVSLVLNGIYLGLYFITETIRVDNNRIEIFEQPDLNEDSSTLPYGWLVEIDNYLDDHQVRFTLPDHRTLRITHHTPEELSELQREFLVDEFNRIISAIYTENKLDRTWEDYIDVESLAKHFVVQELVHNMDTFVGSCYMFRDIDSKWSFSTLWDLSWSLDREATNLAFETGSERMFIDEIYKFPEFRKKVKEVYDGYMETYGLDWATQFFEQLHDEIFNSLVKSGEVWTNVNLYPWTGYKSPLNMLLANKEYLDQRFDLDCRVYNIHHTVVDLKDVEDSLPDDNVPEDDVDINDNSENNEDDSDTSLIPNAVFDSEDSTVVEQDSDSTADMEIEPKSSKILLNGLDINDVSVLPGMDVAITFVPYDGYKLEKVILNGEDCTNDVMNNVLLCRDIDDNLDVEAIFSKISAGISEYTYDIAIPVIQAFGNVINIMNHDSCGEVRISDLSGTLIFDGVAPQIILPHPGVYILTCNQKAYKIVI